MTTTGTVGIHSIENITEDQRAWLGSLYDRWQSKEMSWDQVLDEIAIAFKLAVAICTEEGRV